MSSWVQKTSHLHPPFEQINLHLYKIVHFCGIVMAKHPNLVRPNTVTRPVGCRQGNM